MRLKQHTVESGTRMIECAESKLPKALECCDGQDSTLKLVAFALLRCRARTRPDHCEMSLPALATVLLQLIYQQLSCAEIFKLARCSRALRDAADSRVAFKYVRALVVKSSQLAHLPPFGQLYPLRKCPLHLVCVGQFDFDVLDRMVHALQNSNLHAVDLRLMSIPKNLWKPLLSHEMMQNVRSLVCDERNEVTEAALQCIAKMPRLTCLAVQPPVKLLPRGFVWLQKCPALTSLQTRGWDAPNGEPAMLPIQRLPHLTNLSLHQPSLYWTHGFNAPALRRLLTGPPLCTQLRSLTLRMFVADPARYSSEWTPAPIEDYIAAFSALTCLTSLELVNISSIDHLMSHAHATPALTDLTMAAEVEKIHMLHMDALVPSEAAMERLLSAAPTLRCVLRVSVTETPNPMQWQTCMQMCPLLHSSQRFDGRLVVRSTVPTPR